MSGRPETHAASRKGFAFLARYSATNEKKISGKKLTNNRIGCIIFVVAKKKSMERTVKMRTENAFAGKCSFRSA